MQRGKINKEHKTVMLQMHKKIISQVEDSLARTSRPWMILTNTQNQGNYALYYFKNHIINNIH